jgi:hypothetical protein
MAARWFPSSSMVGDLSKAHAIAVAALEATEGSKSTADDRRMFASQLRTAVGALDGAIAIAERNKPKSKTVSEDLPDGF